VKKIKVTISLSLIFAVVLFVVQNSAIVEIKFLIWSFSSPRVFLVVSLIAIGFVLGLLVSSIYTLRHPEQLPANNTVMSDPQLSHSKSKRC
jgi:uncharacterized integral membrane protein